MSDLVVAFGPFSFDRASLTLTREGKRVAVGTRGAALLRALIDGNGAVVGKDDLLEAAWPGTVVEESNLSVQIALLRKLLGERDDGSDWITTVPRVGYRLVRAVGLKTSAEPHLPRMAVMPFHNLSGDPDQEYFADGMVDDLIAALSRFRSFVVIGRRPAFARKGHSADPQELAQGARRPLSAGGQRAAILAAAQAGTIPNPPAFSTETHKRFRPKLEQVVKMVKAGDIAGLKAFEINPVSSSPKAVAKYRDLAVIALEAKGQAPST
jgi:DNA-binding winged helix-turn-helix (wHTH) protein